ncbi:MAG TPA: transcriptional regulator, partial [Methanoregulaceae archaeon]|nr:transcriptional regulator [Methanoregulaceae archaeon]
YTPVTILLCALGGIPGALIIIILQLLGIPVG